MGTAIAKHGSWKNEDAEEEREEADKDSGPKDLWKCPVGRNTIRFLPPKVGQKTPFVKCYEHFMTTADGRRVRFACPRHHAKRPCPSCNKADELRATGNPEDYKVAGDYIAKRRIYANMIDRAAPERGVVVWPFGKTVYDALLSLRTSEESGGDFTDPGQEGFDIVIEKSGQGLKTEYKVQPSRKNSPLGNDEWLESMHDLSRFAVPPTADELAVMLKPKNDEGDATPPARGRNSGSSGGTRRRSAADDTIDTDGEAVDD